MPLLGTVFDHHWDRPSELMTLGTLTGGGSVVADRRPDDAGRPGAVERAAGARASTTTSSSSAPTVPHEVAGFAGGAKYFFPGVAGPELTHLTHWLGALATIERVIGRVETPTRRVIEAAADRVTTPVIAFTSVSTRRRLGPADARAVHRRPARDGPPGGRGQRAGARPLHRPPLPARHRAARRALRRAVGRRQGQLQARRHHRGRRRAGHLRAAPQRHLDDARRD